jgi:hypothetical protein
MAIFLGFAASAFGKVSFNTPFSYTAAIFDESMLSPKMKDLR